MRSSRLLWLCFFLCFLAALAHADNVPADPTMQVDDPQCTGTQVVTPGRFFSFSAGGPGPTAGGGCTGFVNNPGNVDNPGIAITSLDIETIDPNIDPTQVQTQVKCLSNAFEVCQARVLNGGVLDMFLTICNSDNTCLPGIAAGQAFSINLSDLLLDANGNPIPDPNDPGAFQTVAGGGWIPGEGFSGIANVSQPTTPFLTPEPSSLFLLATGVAAIGRKKKILKLF